MKRQEEQGNVLFLILVAVMLFGTLSFTVAQMMRSGNPESIGERQASLYADEILGYARQIRESVQSMRISNGCSDTDISFENNFVAGYTNGGAPADNSCHVFEGDGGGVAYIEPPEDWLDPAFSAQSEYGNNFFDSRNCVDSLPDGDWNTCFSDGLDNEELIYVQPFIKKVICVAINERLGISNPSDDAPTDTGCSWGAKFTGSYSEAASIGAASGELDGKVSGCYKQDAGCVGMPNSYHFYQVLITR